MSSFIEKEMAKLEVNQETYYVCMFVHGTALVNLAFYKKEGEVYQTLLRHQIQPELSQALITKVRSNEVIKLTPSEVKEFKIALNKNMLHIKEGVKKFVNKKSENIKADYIGEVAGIYYIVISSKELPFKQLYLIQEDKLGQGYEIGQLPHQYIEMVLLDIAHHMNISNKAIYLAVGEHTIIGLKTKNQSSNHIFVTSILINDNNVSANKAYIISMKNLYEYELLSIQDSTPELIEDLRVESKNMVHDIIKKLDMEIV